MNVEDPSGLIRLAEMLEHAQRWPDQVLADLLHAQTLAEIRSLDLTPPPTEEP